METTWDGANWTCEIELRSWRDHLPRGGSGRIRVVFTPEGADEGVPPSKVQLATVERLREDQAAVLDAMTTAMRKHYDGVRPRLLEHSVKNPGFFKNFTRQMPKAPDDREFARLHELVAINVHPVSKGKLAYCGIQLRADWDVEHGLGVLMHGTRAVRVGGADTAILAWMAKEDATPASKRAAVVEPGAEAGKPVAARTGEVASAKVASVKVASVKVASARVSKPRRT